MSNSLISILMAVYNGERYLREALDSLLAQTYANWQLLCVDDGSTDSSRCILKEYSERDSRIVVIESAENQGAGNARNLGLEKAEGEIIMMLDCDDWLSADALQLLRDAFAADAEMDTVLLTLRYVELDGEMLDFRNEIKDGISWLSGREACLLAINWRIHGVYAARRRLYDSYPYDCISKVYSDDNTTRLHYLHSRKVGFCNGVYYYRQHPLSSTARKDKVQWDILTALDSLRQSLAGEGLDENALHLVDLQKWRNVMGGYMYYYARRRYLDEEERAELRAILDRHYFSTPTKGLPLSLKFRFGYAPIKWCPPLYRLQMRIFTRLRLLLGMDKHRYD